MLVLSWKFCEPTFNPFWAIISSLSGTNQCLNNMNRSQLERVETMSVETLSTKIAHMRYHPRTSVLWISTQSLRSYHADDHTHNIDSQESREVTKPPLLHGQSRERVVSLSYVLLSPPLSFFFLLSPVVSQAISHIYICIYLSLS